VVPCGLLDPYLGLIYASWLRSLRYGNDFFKLTDAKSYYLRYHDYIRGILYNPECTIRLALLADDPDVALGWSVSRGHILDYVYVLPPRRHGVGRALIPDGIDTFTHITWTGAKIWASKFPDWKFNPFA